MAVRIPGPGEGLMGLGGGAMRARVAAPRTRPALPREGPNRAPQALPPPQRPPPPSRPPQEAPQAPARGLLSDAELGVYVARAVSRYAGHLGYQHPGGAALECIVRDVLREAERAALNAAVARVRAKASAGVAILVAGLLRPRAVRGK